MVLLVLLVCTGLLAEGGALPVAPVCIKLEAQQERPSSVAVLQSLMHTGATVSAT